MVIDKRRRERDRKVEWRRGDFTKPRERERENKGVRQEWCGTGRAKRTILEGGIRCNQEEKRKIITLPCWILIGWLTFGLTRLGFISWGEDW